MLDSLEGILQTFSFERVSQLITVTQNQPNKNSISEGKANQLGIKSEALFSWTMNESQESKGKDTEM